MSKFQNITNQNSDLSFVRCLSLGFKVVLEEIHWNIIRGLRAWEIKQLNQRLQREYQIMGKLTLGKTEDSDQQESEIDLCKKQIEFLEQEIDFLKKDLNDLRENIILQRRQKWGI